MDYSKLPIYRMMQQQMNYNSERQSVLARNIANADTPGYVPYEVKGPDFSALVKKSGGGGGVQIAVTQPGHMKGGGGDANSKFRVVKDHDPENISPNGNAVNLDDQLLKMQDNSTDYQTTTSLYRKMNNMFRTALGENTN